jgi:hypothetical protein
LRDLTTFAFFGPFGSLPECNVPALYSRITLDIFFCAAVFFFTIYLFLSGPALPFLPLNFFPGTKDGAGGGAIFGGVGDGTLRFGGVGDGGGVGGAGGGAGGGVGGAILFFIICLLLLSCYQSN